MTPIPTEYTRHGFTFRQIAREGMAAVYEQWKHGRLCAYETVKIRQRNERQAMGVTFSAMEFLPSDGEWGRYGKTYSAGNSACVAARKAAEAQMRVWA